jgi:hypothetical protein
VFANAEEAYRWFLSRAAPLRGSDGSFLYWIGADLDIDDAKRAEEALNVTKEKLARALQMPFLLIRTSTDDRNVMSKIEDNGPVFPIWRRYLKPSSPASRES